MITKLRFIGKDGSMGLVKNRVYLVDLSIGRRYIWVKWTGNACPYSNFKKLLENWEEV